MSNPTDVSNLVFAAQAHQERATAAVVALEEATQQVLAATSTLRRFRTLGLKNLGMVFIAMAFSTAMAIHIARAQLPSPEKLATLERQIADRRAELAQLQGQCR